MLWPTVPAGVPSRFCWSGYGLVYGNRSISSPDVWMAYCQPSRVASYHGSAMSTVTIACRKSYSKEQYMVVVTDRINRGRAISECGQASYCRHYCASQPTEASVGVPQRSPGVTCLFTSIPGQHCHRQVPSCQRGLGSERIAGQTRLKKSATC